MKNIIQTISLLVLLFIFSNEISEAKVFFVTENARFAATKKLIPYDRSLWKHWIDTDKDCLNTRQEILLSRSQSKTNLSDDGCHVEKGSWNDFYAKELLSKAIDIDIDHIVPLKHAHDIGAWKWNAIKKQNFANDPDNLVITNLKYNRSKGAQSIASWLPQGTRYICSYINLWIKIKKKYSLLFKEDEKNVISRLKLVCM